MSWEISGETDWERIHDKFRMICLLTLTLATRKDMSTQ